MRRAWLLLALASCVQSSAQVCDDGTLCPRGYQCDALDDGSGTRCIRPEQLEACNGIEDGLDCKLDGLDGTCTQGACELWFCGDGIRQGFEQCDTTDLGIDPVREVTADCVTVGFYETPGLACNPITCTFDASNCGGGRCGDDTVNGPETCDGDETQTCVAIGFDAGAVTCDQLCSFTIVNCSRFGWNAESLTDLVALAVAGTEHDDQWAVGLDGKAAHFDGVFWIPSATGTTQTLRNAWSISRRDVWVVGEAGTVIRYTEAADGTGGAWAPVEGVPVGDYVDVWATAPNDVYIAAADSRVHHFDGVTWSTLPVLAGTPIAMRGTSGDDLWVATEQGPLQHFDGSTWTATLAPPTTAVKFIDANAADDVWIIGHETGDPGTGVIAHYDGSAWTRFVRAGEIYNNIASSAPNDAWVAGADGLLRHFDGVGFSNSTNVSLPGGVTGISGFLSLGPQEVVGVSTLRLAYRFRGQTFGQFRTLGPDPFTAPTNLAFESLAANDVWMTNLGGQVHRFDGQQWNLATTFSSPSRAIVAFGPDDVWFGRDDGTVVRFTTGFAPPETAATTPITELVEAGSDLWAFSTGFAHRRVGTDDWAGFPLATGLRVRSASASSANDIWAVLDDTAPRLFHFDGDAWSEVTTGATVPLLAVHAVAPDDVHVTGQDGLILHWNGSAFESQHVPTLRQLTSLAGSANDDVIAASDLDAFHYDGRQWAPLRLPEEIKTPNGPTVRAIQASPGRVDLMLERHKILTLIRTRPLFCRASELLGPNSCTDGVDNDCDGALDSTDDECP